MQWKSTTLNGRSTIATIALRNLWHIDTIDPVKRIEFVMYFMMEWRGIQCDADISDYMESAVRINFKIIMITTLEMKSQLSRNRNQSAGKIVVGNLIEIMMVEVHDFSTMSLSFNHVTLSCRIIIGRLFRQSSFWCSVMFRESHIQMSTNFSASFKQISFNLDFRSRLCRIPIHFLSLCGCTCNDTNRNSFTKQGYQYND